MALGESVQSFQAMHSLQVRRADEKVNILCRSLLCTEIQGGSVSPHYCAQSTSAGIVQVEMGGSGVS